MSGMLKAENVTVRYGARTVMYWTFLVGLVCCFLLSYPSTDYVVHTAQGDRAFHLAMGLPGFIVAIFVLGFFMALGKAAVYKHIPVYYPQNVGAVGGLVGMIGGLGGFSHAPDCPRARRPCAPNRARGPTLRG